MSRAGTRLLQANESDGKLPLRPRPEYHWVVKSGKPIRVASMTYGESTPYRTNWVAMIVSCYNYTDHSTNSRFACH